MTDRWPNQQEALDFVLAHNAAMLDMDMGTGKTRVALDACFTRPDARKILIVCPKAVVPVWRTNLKKFYPAGGWQVFDPQAGTIKKKATGMIQFLGENGNGQRDRLFVVVNYDIVWRTEMGAQILRGGFDTVILDESHRAKSAGSKVSKYLAMLGKRVKYRLCLSGTPMANSPLDVYGQFRFLDNSIFGTNHSRFLQQYAILGGPEGRFIVGLKNQEELSRLFRSITYSCKMSDVADRIKLPPALPDERVTVDLPRADYKTMKGLNKELFAECSGGVVAPQNVLVKILRLQQICNGFCMVQDGPLDEKRKCELNETKALALKELLSDIDLSQVVVFCKFQHDLGQVRRVAKSLNADYFELSGATNEVEKWRTGNGVLAVQIQAGAEGIDLTKATHAIYFTLPHSLALYQQSRARLYRPGQARPVHFVHLIAKDTIDEAMYRSLQAKQDIIDSIKSGTFDLSFCAK